MRDDIARLTRERDEARERAAEVPGLRLRLAQAEGSASEAEAAWKTENGKLLAAESRAERLQFQIEREIVFLEEEAATGVSFYEATFTQRAQALRALLGEEGK